MTAAAPWSVSPTGARLLVRLTPKSSRDALEAPEALSDGRLVFKARVRAAPEDGKANEALRRAAAAALDVPVSSVRLAQGATSRIKTLEIAGDPDALTEKLVALASPKS